MYLCPAHSSPLQSSWIPLTTTGIGVELLRTCRPAAHHRLRCSSSKGSVQIVGWCMRTSAPSTPCLVLCECVLVACLPLPSPRQQNTPSVCTVCPEAAAASVHSHPLLSTSAVQHRRDHAVVRHHSGSLWSLGSPAWHTLLIEPSSLVVSWH